MNQLTDKQLIHRAYLRSPLWQVKRHEALAHYGTICGRCGQHGTDVHHRTYERTGGMERMDDLEVLCRSCHEVHHQVERATRAAVTRKANGAICVTALARYLTAKQRLILQERFSLRWGQVYEAIISQHTPAITRAALDMVGKEYAYVHRRKSIPYPRKQDRSRWGGCKHHAKTMS